MPAPRPTMVARVGACGDRDVTLDDLHARRREYVVAPTSALVKRMRPMVRDARDLPLVYALINVASTVPAMAMTVVMSPPSHALGLAYAVTIYGLYWRRFVMAAHYSSHAPAFRGDGTAGTVLNNVASCALGPLFGMPCGLYAMRHELMHHDGDEGSKASGGRGRGMNSTATYARDGAFAFLRYWVRFGAWCFVELLVGAVKRKAYVDAMRCVLGLAATYGVYSYAAAMNATAAFWIFVVPYVAGSFAAAFGSWSQQIFVDPDKPQCHYRSSYCAINHPNNQLTFNDGYYTVHRVDADAHWSDLPEKFIESLDEFARNDGLIFDGVTRRRVGLAVLCGRLGWLADRYVNVGQPARTKEEIVAMLRRRLRPVGKNKSA